MIRWVDSHCHPHLIIDEPDSPKLAIKEAVDGNIRILCVSVEIDDYETFAGYKKLYPNNVVFSAGQHPLHENDNANWEKLAHHAATDKNIVAIGETGFDFQGNEAVQRNAFEKQVEIACANDLPIILHTRDSGDGAIEKLTKAEITNATRVHSNLTGVFHCFTGSIELAEFAINAGWYISFSGIITFKSANSIREVAMHLYKNGYLNKMLIETDSPYLAPTPMRGKTNQPGYVRYVGEYLAQFFEHDLADFAAQLEKNFDTLFKSRE